MEYSIGKFSELTGFSKDTLRYYEAQKIILSHQSENGRHLYTDDDVSWAKIVHKLKSTGMSIKEIKRYTLLTEKGQETIEERMELLFAHSEALLLERKALDEQLMTLYNKIEIYNKMLKSWLIENIKSPKNME
ncbi:MerR family transcriptional regulator [Lactococcus hircilactis]|uniref:MerR family transcriptional regulator n=1 Tax=Lactococcus hircilactis TaxID=1494462 RepID=A0A7X1Z6Y6_9LACT|nr:MerR family transcriptional regulator [Lactococcus hircilactis]MQW38833.1 MerR family transcriptional regulator [Lactococcus hircilactis]